MFHMHSHFDLRPGITADAFATAWSELVADLIAHDMIVTASGLAERRSDTGLDTDEARSLRYFTVISFRDRAQSEAAWDHIAPRAGPTAREHNRVIGMSTNAVFTCWEDLAPVAQGA